MKTFTAKDGVLRLYCSLDTKSDRRGRPFIKVLFVNSDFTAPIGRNRPEETLILDRLKFDGNTHFIQGSDAAIAEPLPCSFSFRAFDRKAGQQLIKAISTHKINNTLDDTEDTIYTLKGYSGLYDYEGNYHHTNNFTDTSKVCFDVELKYPGDTGGSALTVKLHEVLFNQGDQTVNEAEDSVTINLSGNVYGSIDFGSVDWTTGSELTW